MKMSMKNNIRMGLILALSVLVLGAAVMALWQIKQPLTTQKEMPAYKYSQQAQVDYQVLFSNNKYFSDTSAGPGRGYLTPITDSLQTKFHYLYNGAGEQAGRVDGTYTISAAVIGYTMQDKESSQGTVKEKVKVWEKTTELVPPTPFSSSDDKAEINVTVPVGVRDFKQFADQVNEAYKSAVDAVELSVNYNVAIKVNAVEKTTQDQIAPVLVIPLKGNSFIVGGKTSDKDEKTLTSIQTVQIPGVKTARTVYIVLVIVLAILLALMLFLTTAEENDPLKVELENIMKKYGDRIIACDGAAPVITGAIMLMLSSMDDLIKAGDELLRPVLYENIRDGVHTFYIIHENIVYSYKLDAVSLRHSLEKEFGL
ncbi:MAG TPA: DUF5305 family protein [Syntrophomonadaceae bacterium]|nr:DUF5305 family protein [Syntrophomonadaceae bacterium]